MLDVLIPLAFGLITLAAVFAPTTSATPHTVANNTAELNALTAPENLDIQVRQWLRDNPPPPQPELPAHIRQLQAQVFTDYMRDIKQAPPAPHNAESMEPYYIMHTEALRRAKMAAALNAQAKANAALSEALRNEQE